MIAVSAEQRLRGFGNASSTAIERPDLGQDPDFADGRQRLLNRDRLQTVLEEILAGAETETWVQRLKAQGVPSGPINTIDKALADPQVAARGLLAEVDGRLLRAGADQAF